MTEKDLNSEPPEAVDERGASSPNEAETVEGGVEAEVVEAGSESADTSAVDNGKGAGEGSGEDVSAAAADADDVVSDEDAASYDDDQEDDESVVPPFMQNRELSWLTFNERCLDQGADESVPLLDRLNFISIFWSNLQEFFMVRVGSLTDLSYIEPPIYDSKTGMTPAEQIRAIHARCAELYPIQESYYEHVRGALAKQGVRHLRPEDLSDEQRNYLLGFVEHNIQPFLSPQIINSHHPFPHLENGKLYIIVRLDEELGDARKKKDRKNKDKTAKKRGGADGVVLGLIPLPHQCPRIIKLPGRGFHFILLEHAIEMVAEKVFSMYCIKHTNVICVTRNADLDTSQSNDVDDDDYREHMRRLLKKRARLAPVRLECERPLSPVMEKLLLKRLGLKRYQMYDTIVPLDLSFTWGLGDNLAEKKRARLTETPFAPAWPACFDRKRPIMEQVQEKEVLLNYPYDSMDPFVQLLREAALDPSVVSIKITLYRLARQSHLAEALIMAAEAGKEVMCLCELRARFDESNNIEWSQRFEQAGCTVIFGFHDYKVHSKICSITRKTPEGVQYITQLGTGNYNEKTAKLYTDMCFITTDEEFGRDATEFFKNMQLENISDAYKKLRVAPLQIKQMVLEKLDEQIERARAGLPCGAFMKANSVSDKDVIEKLSEASCAGVPITMLVRGICCIVPDIEGATENIRVVSIVGRLLEHSRIYCFGPYDDCEVYLSSADLMTRNLDKRIEIAWPVLAPGIRCQVLEYLETCMKDTAKLRECRPNCTYTPLGSFCDVDDDGDPIPFDSQAFLIEKHAAESEAAAAAYEAEAERQSELAPEPEPAVAVEPEPELATESEPVAESSVEQDSAPDTEPVGESESAPAAESEPEPAEEPLMESEPAIGQELAAEPESAVAEPLPESAAEPKPEPEPEPAAESVLEPVLETAAESESEPASEPAPIPEPATESAPMPETAAEPVSEPVPEPAAESETEPVAKPEIELEREQADESAMETKPENEIESALASEPKLDQASEPKSVIEPEPAIEPVPDPEPETESELKPEIGSVEESEPEPESPHEPEPREEPAAQSAPESVSEADQEPITESSQAPGLEAKPESEPEPVTEPESVQEPAAEPTPEPKKKGFFARLFGL